MMPPQPFQQPSNPMQMNPPNGSAAGYKPLLQSILSQLDNKPPLISPLSSTSTQATNFEERFYEQTNFTDPEAVKDWIVNTFLQYQGYRQSSGIENRWARCDKLWAAHVNPVKWKGSSEYRSNLGLPYSFEQIMTSLPFIQSSIFSTGERWFNLKPGLGYNHFQARIVESHLDYRLDKAQFRAKWKLASLSALKYGLGILEILWDEGLDYNNALQFDYVDVRDIFLDTSVKDHDVEKSRLVIRPIRKTMSQLLALSKTDPRFQLPSLDELVGLYTNSSDTSEQDKERAARYLSDYPSLTEERLSVLWGDRVLEILVGYSKYRTVWVLERKKTIFDQPNKYEIYPFILLPCYLGENSIYPRGFIDIIANYQRYATGLVNASFDNKAIELNPPRFQSSQSAAHGQSNYWFPGLLLKGDSKNDVAVLIPKGISTDVSGELSFLERATEKAIGNNALTQGVPQPGNINRTRAGINSLMSSSSSRNGDLIENFSNYGLQPVVEKVFKIIQKNTPQQGQMITVLTDDGLITQTDSSYLFGDYSICVDVMDRVLTQQKIQQNLPAVLGPVLQFLSSEYIASSNYVVDINELISFIITGIGVGRKFALVREKTQEDLQQQQTQQQQKQQQQDQSKLQEKMIDAQIRTTLSREKSQTALTIAKMNAQTEFAKMDLQKLLSDEDVSKELIKLIIERGSYKPLAESLRPSSDIRERERNYRNALLRKQERNSPVLSAPQGLASLFSQFQQLG